MSDTSESPAPTSGGISEVAQSVRDELIAGRQRIREMHDRGLDGPQVCGRLTSLVDGAISKLFSAAETELGSALPKNLRAKMALVALGGYGRRQSAPYSDVDLMILHDNLPQPELTAIVRRFTNSVYDAGMQLGHSVRTAAEAVQLARSDAIICSSLIDSRLIAGSQPLLEEFRSQFEKMVRKRAKAACKMFFDAREEERAQYGESLYLLEPHVKRSRGGLRDIHLMRWIGYAEYGESEPDLLHLRGALTKFEHHRLLTAQLFLLRLRNEMHFAAGTSKDLLDRAEQLRVANVFGYRGGEGLLPVERLMKDYFHHTNDVWQMVRRREAAATSETRVSRILDPVVGRNVGRDYRVGVRSLGATRTGLAKLEGNLEEVLRLVELSALEDKPLDHATQSALVLMAPEVSEEMTPGVADRFMQILARPTIVGQTLRTLHELGYLEKVIPPLKHARCLLQFNQYHKYTVDEHSLVAVDEAAGFFRRTDALGAAYRAMTSKALLHLTLLLHDLGKGFEEDHSEIGRRIALEMGARLGLDERLTADMAYLIHKHLMMNHLAFRRDTDDPQVLQEFAASVETADRLRMLFVVSCADLAAVGPDVFNDWKLGVLTNLYAKTLPLLESAPDETSVAASKKLAEAWTLLDAAEQADDWFRRQFDALPAAIAAAYPAAAIVQSLRRMRQLPPRGGKAWGIYRPEAKTLDFIIGVNEGRGRGLLSRMAGVLSSQGLEILAAESQVMADDMLLLRYAAHDPESGGQAPQHRIDDVVRRLEAAIESTEPLRFRKLWGQETSQASAKLSAMPNEVRVDNAASSRATVVEVFTFDRTGLLYQLGRKLHELDLTIWHAKIATYIDQVVDVFYVTNRDGGKLLDPERIETIRQGLFAVIDEKE